MTPTNTPETVERLREALEIIAGTWGELKPDPSNSLASAYRTQRDMMQLTARNALAALAPKPDEVTVPEGMRLSGWASPTLSRAYIEIERLRDNLNPQPDSDIGVALRGVLDAIELADCELVGAAS